MILAKNLQIIKHYKTLLLLAMKDKTDLEPCRKKNHWWTLLENRTSPSTMNHKKMKTLWAHLLETSSNNPHKMRKFKSPSFNCTILCAKTSPLNLCISFAMGITTQHQIHMTSRLVCINKFHASLITL
jgi:hypothetical protein